MQRSPASAEALSAHTIAIQRCLITLAILTLIELVVTIVYAHIGDGTFGMFTDVTESSFQDSVGTVFPGFPAARAGLKPGDVIDLAALPAAQRFRMRYGWPTAGDRYELRIRRGHTRQALTIVANRSVNDDPFWIANRLLFYVRFFGNVVMLAVAAFIAYRRPGHRDVAFLALLLIAITLGNSTSGSGTWQTPWAGLDASVFCLGTFIANLGFALLATFALRFGHPVSRLRMTFTLLAFACAIATAVINAFAISGLWFGTFDANVGVLAAPVYDNALALALYGLPMLCAGLAIRAARGKERSRIVWATGSLSLLYVGPILDLVVQNQNLGFVSLSWCVRNVPYFIAPFGLAYALLGHRLLDIGFALNRAVVFTGVSIVILGTFTLVEWALGGYLQSASKSTNTIISALLALALGLSIHPIHLRVDRFVDGVFFRKRHDAEQTLRAFGREAAYITDARTLLDRAQAILERSTDCAWSEIALYDGVSRFGKTDENDPAIVTLRSTHQSLNLHTISSSLDGEFAFPMSARGRLVGALVVGPKRQGESYAPDELSAIGVMAHGMGIALDVLGVSASNAGEELLEEIRALRASFVESNRAVVDSLERLRHAVIERSERTGLRP